MQTPTRRMILSGIATAGTATLAGCQTTPSTSAAQFDSVTTDGTALVVELDSASEIDQLTVIDPDGSAFTEVEATAGQTRYSIDIGTAYTPGEYELNTVTDGEITAIETIDLQPELEITEVKVGENHPDEFPDDLTFAKSQIKVSVQNTGTGPEAITNLEIIGKVPNPTTRENQSESGIFATERGYGEVDSLVIGADETLHFFSSTHPFAGKSDYCQDGTFQVTLVTSVSEPAVSQMYRVQYQSSSHDGCPITIQEAE